MEIAGAGILHDIGLKDAPEFLLEKKGIISPEEQREIAKHPLQGFKRLRDIKEDYELISSIVLNHHEQVDGSGYPTGVRSFSEIVELFGVADFFESVTHHRPQRGPLTPHQGMKMLLGEQRDKFSPGVIKAFLSSFSLFPVGTRVKLNSGEVGRVVKTNPQWPLRPVIEILEGSDGRPIKGRKEVDLRKDKVLFIIEDSFPNKSEKEEQKLKR